MPIPGVSPKLLVLLAVLAAFVALVVLVLGFAMAWWPVPDGFVATLMSVVGAALLLVRSPLTPKPGGVGPDDPTVRLRVDEPFAASESHEELVQKP